MQQLIVLFYKAMRRIKYRMLSPFRYRITSFLFYCNNVKRGTFKTTGVPFVSVARGGIFSIGNHFRINNTIEANPIGRIQTCSFSVHKKGVLTIGDNVAMSFTAIHCSHRISIGDNVMIGGGTCIYDTDFHPLAIADRLSTTHDEKTASGPVVIEENVFVGAHCTILKGVRIGNNSIVGACSVVTKNIPANEIWAGNPAKFIKAHTPHTTIIA